MNKLIFAHKETCGNCKFMLKLMEQPKIKCIINTCYSVEKIDTNKSTDWRQYTKGLPKKWYLPLVVKLNESGVPVDRFTGRKTENEFQKWLSKTCEECSDGSCCVGEESQCVGEECKIEETTTNSSTNCNDTSSCYKPTQNCSDGSCKPTKPVGFISKIISLFKGKKN